MDDLAEMQSFRAERVRQNPTARAEAWEALEARFELAPSTPAPIGIPLRRRRLLPQRHRLLAFAGATVTAAVLAGGLVLDSGPTAQPAAAEVLNQTAAVAAAADGLTGVPGPGEFLFMKTKSMELQEWAPDGYTGSYGGMDPKPEGAFGAFVTWEEEVWASQHEASRHRWTMGTPQFLSDAEQSRWEQAGSPPPSPFACDRKCFPEARILEASPGVMDIEGVSGFGFQDFSSLPLEPMALRLAIEGRQGAGPSNAGQVISELWDILDKPNTTPPLRSAAFGALAEVPGIELDRDAEDLTGRPGYALSHESSPSSSYGAHLPGLRVEYIFDPETSAILGRRETITDPAKLSWLKDVPPGTVRREVAYLQSGLVDSTDAKPAERDDGPVATTGPVLHG